MKNKLTVSGKFKIDFEDWYYKQEYDLLGLAYDKEDSAKIFYNLSLPFKYGVIKAFADSKGYILFANRDDWGFFNMKLKLAVDSGCIFDNLEQSQISVINKLVEIYNEK